MQRPFVLLTLLLLVLSACLAVPVQAQPEKILDTPAGWTYLYGATSSTINAEVNAGRRPFQIKRVAANSYDVITVANSGAYAMPGFGTGNMHYNRTLSQLSGELTNRRLVSLDCYDTSGLTLMSAVSIPNTGAQGAGWGWLVGQTRQQIIDWVANSTTPLRILDLSIYISGGQKRYSAVAVVNQGAQQQGWWWYFDKTGEEVGQLLTQNDARLVDIELETAPTILTPARYAVVMVAQNPGANWVYTSLTASQVNEAVGQTGGRLTNLHRYTNAFGNTRFAVCLVDNADQPTRRLRDLMAGEFNQGVYGFKLKRVGGPVEKSLNEQYVFEPASTLKILHGAYAVYQTANNLPNAIGLDDEIWVPNRCGTTYWNNVCPDTDYFCNSGDELLRTTVSSMMRSSHNGRTRTIEDLFGRSTINNFASQLGGTSNTEINHYIGCGEPPNTTTADDMVRFYERIGDGTFFDGGWRDELAGMMQNLDSNGWSGGGRNGFQVLDQIISDEAAGTSLTSAEILSFKNNLQIAHKIGGYWNGDGTFVSSSVAGWAQIPFKVNFGGSWITLDRDYAFAVYVSGALDGENEYVYTQARLEILREEIREALATWDASCSPGIAQQPSNVTVDQGEDAQFVVAAGGAGAADYQWQRLIGSTWSTLSDIAGQYSGTATSTLAVLDAQPDQAGSYRCRVIKSCGTTTSNPATLTVIPGSPTGVPHALPTHLVMHAPAPNPFNPQVTLRYDLPRATDLVVLEVFDVAGRRVRSITATSLPAGANSMTWNGTDDTGRKVASGTYLARLRAGREQATHRLTLVE